MALPADPGGPGRGVGVGETRLPWGPGMRRGGAGARRTQTAEATSESRKPWAPGLEPSTLDASGVDSGGSCSLAPASA